MQNLGFAFHLIAKEFAVPRLLETEDMGTPEVLDPRAVAVYLIEIRTVVEQYRQRQNKLNFEIHHSAMVCGATSKLIGRHYECTFC